MYFERSLSFICVSILASFLGACSGGGSGTSEQIPLANFSDYYPLSKGLYREYQVFDPSSDSYTYKEVWTSGKAYGGQETVRSSIGPKKWYDEAYINGQVLLYGEMDEEGLILVDIPIIKGIDDWVGNNTIYSSATLTRNNTSYPILVAVTYRGLETVTVSYGTFSDCMKIEFSINDGQTSGFGWFAHGVGLVKEAYGDGTLYELINYGSITEQAPSISESLPQVGYDGGGTLITITGSGLTAGVSVTVGGELAESVTVVDSNTINAITPPGVVGLTDVTVINPDLQVDVYENGFEYWTPSLAGSYSNPTFANDIYISYPYALVAAGYDGLQIINISNPANPVLSGFFDHSNLIGNESDAIRVQANGSDVFVLYGDGTLRVIDISNASVPTQIGSYFNPYLRSDFFLIGNTAYLTGSGADGGFKIIDMSDPATPSVIGAYHDYQWDAGQVYVSGDYAYVSACYSGGINCGIYVINITNPSNLSLSGFYAGSTGRVIIEGTYAYIASGSDGIQMLDVSEPSSPSLIGTYQASDPLISYEANDVIIRGNYAYVNYESGMVHVIDISNPATPIYRSSFDAGYDKQTNVVYSSSLDIDGLYIYQAGSDLNMINILQ